MSLSTASRHFIDLDVATAEELMTIEGIDAARARAILARRLRLGHLRSWQDLRGVWNLDDRVLARIAGATGG